MQARNWNLDKDYPYLVNWWKQHEFGKVPQECLPPDGIIIEENNIPICAGGLYCCTGTKFGFMEWIVIDKTINFKLAHTALNLCIQNIINLAEKKNIKLLYTVTGEPALQKRYIKYHNMQLAENNVKTFIKNLTKDNYKNLDWISDDIQIKKQKEENK
jgi:N-acetylglutamate synthase-like GNAT family acetyltransferase|tara:strand:+ start:158 stop:631 length:474 start_codon:yes stop_codon:yes gene_type:complete